MPTVEFHALNISALPHPPGIYKQLFTRFSGSRVQYYGEKFATFSAPSETKDGVFYGRIITWTQIDKRQPMIDTVLLEAPNPETIATVNIPDQIGFNAQVFYYAFRESDHILVFESRNADNFRLGAKNAERLFRQIFSKEKIAAMQFDDVSPMHVEVDLFVDHRELERILRLENIQYIQVDIALPNKDDDTASAEEIIERMQSIKAERMTISYRAISPDQSIKADLRLENEGQAALRHGKVEGFAYEKGRRVEFNSKDSPKKESAFIDSMSSAIDTILQITRKSFRRGGEPKAN